jgi:hypothetical protein
MSPKSGGLVQRPPLFGGKKKRLDKFYQQQCNLLENFENDSKQIQVVSTKILIKSWIASIKSK